MVKGLGSPLEMGKKKEVKDEAVEQAVEAAVEGTVQPVEQPTPLDISAAIPEAEEMQSETLIMSAEGNTAALETEPEQKVEAEKPKRQRPKPQKAVDAGLSKSIDDLTERLNAPVESLSADQFKDANAQIKQLRDLVMVAVRRIANLTDAMAKTADGAVEMCNAVKALISK